MKRVAFYFLFLSCLTLTGCVAERLAFWSSDSIKKQYYINGLDHDKDSKEYTQSIMEERFSEGLSVSEDDDYQEVLSFKQEFVRRDMLRALHARGYYDAEIVYKDLNETSGSYDVKSGQLYTIGSVQIVPAKYSKNLDQLSIKSGDPLTAISVLKAQSKILNLVQSDSCAFNESIKHKVKIRLNSKIGDIIYEVDQGKNTVFGDLTFTGQDRTKEEYLSHFIKWKPDDCFSHPKIVAAKDKLLASGLFSRVDIKFPKDAKSLSSIPVEIVLAERAARSVKTGLSYYTDEGVAVLLGWEHRNFLGGAEKVNADLSLSVIEQALDFKFSKPYFYREDQALLLNVSFAHEDTDAFDQFGVSGGAAIKRSFNKRLSGRLGIDFELTRIEEDSGEQENFGLVSPYGALAYDSRDDTLDPHKGWLLGGSLKPFYDMLGESDPFFKSEFSAHKYYELHKKAVLAARLMVGSIFVTNTEDIPATERFYSGGGGSVRGFGYQEVGPFEDDDPQGGRSLFEGSLEMRFKITDKIGAVTFADVGHVSDEVTPSFDNLSVGAGAGIRYYTDFGPLRFDFAVPVSGKDNTDQNFQVYISIGQAF